MKIYLAGSYSRRHHIFEDCLKVFLAGTKPWAADGIYDDVVKIHKPYILESYFELSKGQNDYFQKTRHFFGDFLLDSGAFTFMSGTVKGSNWNQYARDYANYIKTNGVKNYFELDLDSLMSLDKVEGLRKLIEDITGIPSIPVWHKSRGLDYWFRMCEDYKYIAIGGIVSGEIKRNQYDVFHKLISIADKHKAKVHGLGFTNITGVKKYKFYSVDSTGWLFGNRGGFLYKFNGQDFDKIYMKDKRMKGKEAAAHNFTEWVKFSQYMERHF